jgi:hypothetical protein
VIEALGRMISTAVNGGLMEGFSVGDNAFSHLLFADDALIFVMLCSHLCHLRSLFLCFGAALSLKVNLDKSELVPMGIVFSG